MPIETLSRRVAKMESISRPDTGPLYVFGPGFLGSRGTPQAKIDAARAAGRKIIQVVLGGPDQQETSLGH